MKRLILLAGTLAVTVAWSSGAANASNNFVSSDRNPRVAAPAAVPTTGAAIREVTLPAGTVLPVTLETAVGSDISRVEQPVEGRLRRAVTYHGVEVLPLPIDLFFRGVEHHPRLQRPAPGAGLRREEFGHVPPQVDVHVRVEPHIGLEARQRHHLLGTDDRRVDLRRQSRPGRRALGTGADWDATIHVDVIPTDCIIEVDGREIMRDGKFTL